MKQFLDLGICAIFVIFTVVLAFLAYACVLKALMIINALLKLNVGADFLVVFSFFSFFLMAILYIGIVYEINKNKE